MRAVDPSLGRSVVMSMAKSFVAVVGILGALLVAGTGLASPTLTEQAERRQTALTPSDNPAMIRAFARARSELDGFLQRARNPGAGEQGFAVKIPVRHGGHTEYFWIAPFQEDGDRIKGRINNRPQYVRNVTKGQTVAFSRADIVDWMYLKGSTMHGNYTACALLADRPAAEAVEFRNRFGLQC